MQIMTQFSMSPQQYIIQFKSLRIRGVRPYYLNYFVYSEVATYSFEEIILLIEKATGVDSERLIHEKYNRQVAAARDMAIYIVIQLGIMTKTELSKRLPVSLVTIIKSYNKVAGDELLKLVPT